MIADSPVQATLKKRLGVDEDPIPDPPDPPPPGTTPTYDTGAGARGPNAPTITTNDPPFAPAGGVGGLGAVAGGTAAAGTTGGAPAAPGNPVDLIRQYQASHQAAGGNALNDMVAFLKQNGVNASRYVDPTWGQSNNELDFGQGKYKVYSEGGHGWYTGGDDSAPPSAAAAAPATNDFQNQIRALLMQQLQQFSQPVDANDPQIAKEMQAQSNVLERTRQDRRAAAAERAAADGLLNGGQGSGSFEGDVASGYEDKGNALTGIQSQLFGREIQSRRDKMAQLMSLAVQSGDADSARALQMQIAQMDDQLKRLGLAQSQSQFNDQFGLSAGQFQYQKDRDAALAGLGN
jgi:hypothetical protein